MSPGSAWPILQKIRHNQSHRPKSPAGEIGHLPSPSFHSSLPTPSCVGTTCFRRIRGEAQPYNLRTPGSVLLNTESLNKRYFRMDRLGSEYSGFEMRDPQRLLGAAWMQPNSPHNCLQNIRRGPEDFLTSTSELHDPAVVLWRPCRI